MKMALLTVMIVWALVIINDGEMDIYDEQFEDSQLLVNTYQAWVMTMAFIIHSTKA